MIEYVERWKLRARLDEIVAVNGVRNDRAWFTPFGVDALICEIPAADVRPVVRGQWENDHKGKYSPYGDNYFCSNCGDPSLRAFGKPAKTNFCPNCGADMRPDKTSAPTTEIITQSGT